MTIHMNPQTHTRIHAHYHTHPNTHMHTHTHTHARTRHLSKCWEYTFLRFEDNLLQTQNLEWKDLIFLNSHDLRIAPKRDERINRPLTKAFWTLRIDIRNILLSILVKESPEMHYFLNHHASLCTYFSSVLFYLPEPPAEWLWAGAFWPIMHGLSEKPRTLITSHPFFDLFTGCLFSHAYNTKLQPFVTVQ